MRFASQIKLFSNHANNNTAKFCEELSSFYWNSIMPPLGIDEDAKSSIVDELWKNFKQVFLSIVNNHGGFIKN